MYYTVQANLCRTKAGFLPILLVLSLMNVCLWIQPVNVMPRLLFALSSFTWSTFSPVFPMHMVKERYTTLTKKETLYHIETRMHALTS